MAKPVNMSASLQKAEGTIKIQCELYGSICDS